MRFAAPIVLIGTLACSVHASAAPTDRDTVAGLDTAFQAAVKANDADSMARILHKDMVLVHGDGRIDTRAEQIQEARDKVFTYERQEEDPGTQVVRVLGDTAVVTARLWIKGLYKGASVERRLWFSDVYVRTASGWQYFFGQVSLHLPDEQAPSATGHQG
jgi:ketosteroid isomerase-like protein